MFLCRLSFCVLLYQCGLVFIVCTFDFFVSREIAITAKLIEMHSGSRVISGGEGERQCVHTYRGTGGYRLPVQTREGKGPCLSFVKTHCM